MVSAPILYAARKAGTPQGLVLLCVAILPIMGVTLIAPIVPRMAAEFHATPGAEFLVPIALTIPALCIALLSPVMGALADRFGRRRLLLASTVFYAIFGVAPMFLTSLGSIIASRVGVGITEAALMTCSTTMLGDYFHGAARGKWMAYQTAVASTAAAVLFIIGGILGEHNWRTPFIMYASSLLVLAAFLVLTWEPQKSTAASAASMQAFPWRHVGGIAAVTFLSAIIFYVVPLQMGYVFGQLGVMSPATIGIATGVATLAVIAGTLVFKRFADRPVSAMLFASFVFAGGGLIGIAHVTDARMVVIFAVINQFGCGLLLPTLLTWAMRNLSFEMRGRGTGMFMMSFFAGQFVSPILIIVLSKQLTGLFAALQVLGIVCVCAALPAVINWSRAPQARLAAD